MTLSPPPGADGVRLTVEAGFYCSYCDDYAGQPCARCGHRALSMRPVKDAYYLAGAALSTPPKEG